MTNASVERARAKAKGKAWTVEKILSQLESIPQFDHKFWEHCKSMQDVLIPALLGAMQHQDSTARLNAILLLLHLGEPRGTDGIIACLRDPDETLRQKTLLNLSLPPPEPFSFAKDLPFKPQPVPLKKEPLFAELKSFLSHSNAYYVELSLKAIRNINPSNATPFIQPLLKHPARDVRIEALRWYAYRSESPEALPIAQELLFSHDVQPTDNYWVISPLEIYCKSENKELSSKAATLLAHFILTHVDYPGNDMSNFLSNAMSGLKKAKYDGEREVAKALFQSSIKDWRRGVALRRIAEINGKVEGELLQTSLSDRTLRPFAAQGITKIFEGSGDASLIESLTSALQNENRENVIGDLVSALVAVAGPSATSIVDAIETLPPYDAMRIHWLSNKIKPKNAANLLVKAKVIDPPPKELLQQLRMKWEKDHRSSYVIFDLLSNANRLFWFDRETSKVPVDYVELLEELVKISHGVFDAESFSQEDGERTDATVIQFVSGNQAHTFKTHNIGGWYDAESVLKGLNEALEKLDKSERFILLYTGDQTCAVTFALESDFRRVAHKLRLPIEVQ